MPWDKIAGIGGGVLSAAGGIFSTVAGIRQADKGNKILNNLVDPIYKRPSEIGRALGLTENNYFNDAMPGRQQFLDQIGSSNANALDNSIQAASSGGDVQDMIAKLNYNEQGKMARLGVQ